MLAARLCDHDDTPVDDHIVVLREATWADYQRHLEIRGEHPIPRLAYLEGALELMSPSREHESVKSKIACLLDVWCMERGIEFAKFGSWTLENKEANRGAEPDECYVFGQAAETTRPDLAIEVIWTSGGLDKREIYRKLGVPEIWFWRRGRLSVHVLRGEHYEEVTASQVLPDIDLDELARFLDRPTTSQAIRDYRDSITARR